MAVVRYMDLEAAFFFVSSQPPCTNRAILCRHTGEFYYISGYGDSDELPDDVDYSDRYVEIPHKNDFDLGRGLVHNFVSWRLPEAYDEVERIFSRKGAYSRFKELLESTRMLEDWYECENSGTEEALTEWCTSQGLDIEYAKST